VLLDDWPKARRLASQFNWPWERRPRRDGVASRAVATAAPRRGMPPRRRCSSIAAPALRPGAAPTGTAWLTEARLRSTKKSLPRSREAQAKRVEPRHPELSVARQRALLDWRVRRTLRPRQIPSRHQSERRSGALG
jgi:hypothetical protein